MLCQAWPNAVGHLSAAFSLVLLRLPGNQMRETPVKPGTKWGRLTVIQKLSKNEHGHVRWACLCECGRRIEVWGYNLAKQYGNTRSCGVGECLIWARRQRALSGGETFPKVTCKHGRKCCEVCIREDERERCAKLAESDACLCESEDLHDGCCGTCGRKSAEKIRNSGSTKERK